MTEKEKEEFDNSLEEYFTNSVVVESNHIEGVPKEYSALRTALGLEIVIKVK